MYLAEKLQACEAKCKQTNISHRRGSLLRFPWPRRALRVTGKPFPASPRSRGAPSPPTRGNLAPPRPTQTPLRHARNNRRVNNHFHSRLHHNFAAVLYRARATRQDFFFISLPDLEGLLKCEHDFMIVSGRPFALSTCNLLAVFIGCETDTLVEISDLLALTLC